MAQGVIPIRLQLRRTARWNLQAASLAINGLPAISCARPGRWGNPIRIGLVTRELAVELFGDILDGCWSPSKLAHLTDDQYRTVYQDLTDWRKRQYSPPSYGLHALAGHNLACFCGLGDLCHVDILIERANR